MESRRVIERMSFINQVVLSGEVVGKLAVERGPDGGVVMSSFAFSDGRGVLPLVVSDPLLAGLLVRDHEAGHRHVFLTGSLSDRDGRICVEVTSAKGHDLRMLGGVSAVASVAAPVAEASVPARAPSEPSSASSPIPSSAPAVASARPAAPGGPMKLSIGGPPKAAPASAPSQPSASPVKTSGFGLSAISKPRVEPEAQEPDVGASSESPDPDDRPASVSRGLPAQALPTRDDRKKRGVMNQMDIDGPDLHSEIPF